MSRPVRRAIPDANTGSQDSLLVAVENVRLMTASHAAVDIGSLGPHCREFGDPGMVGSEVTHRIGRCGVAGECESLAAAAPEIDVTTWTARARLLHPCGAAEGVEGRRDCPDIGERSLA